MRESYGLAKKSKRWQKIHNLLYLASKTQLRIVFCGTKTKIPHNFIGSVYVLYLIYITYRQIMGGLFLVTTSLPSYSQIYIFGPRELILIGSRK